MILKANDQRGILPSQVWEQSIKYNNRGASFNQFKLMKGKALRKHSLHEKTAASVLLKLFISGNE